MNPGWVWLGQICASPARHQSHRPQPLTNGAVTRSPGAKPRTWAPTAAITPANSCPGMCGSRTASWPRQACQSDRHTPWPNRDHRAILGQSGSATSRTRPARPQVIDDRFHHWPSRSAAVTKDSSSSWAHRPACCACQTPARTEVGDLEGGEACCSMRRTVSSCSRIRSMVSNSMVSKMTSTSTWRQIRQGPVGQ